VAAIAAAGVERLDDVHHLAAMCSVGILRKCKALVFSEKNFYLKKDRFTKTGSGQKGRDSSKKIGCFSFAGVCAGSLPECRRMVRPLAGEKTALFVHFLYEFDHFAKTGSGQTWKKLKKSVLQAR
jgi:hypothetical protein